MKKNVEAIRLADMGSSLPKVSNLKYSKMPEDSASTKLMIAETSETLCSTPFLLAIKILI